MPTCGTGTWTGPLPGDPDNNVTLQATSVFGGVRLSWTYPSTFPHAVAHTYLFKGVTSNFALAPRIAVVAGNNYFDQVDDITVDTSFYYWIQIVSVNGTEAEVIGPVIGTAHPAIETVLVNLTNRIDSGKLANAFKDEINIINIAATQASVDVQTLTEMSGLLSNVIGGVQGELDEAKVFLQDEILTRTNQHSALVYTIDSLSSGFNDSIASIVDENFVFIDGSKSIAARTTELETTVDGIVAGVDVVTSARVDALEGIAESMYVVKLTADDLVGGFGLYNDSVNVEAGFDVDTFWVGRTSADKVKPFIISGGEVYINEAVINKITVDKLFTADGGVNIVSGNVINSDYLDLNWDAITGTNKPVDGATRNVFRGNWTLATAYIVGDTVYDKGSSWTCVTAHTSAATVYVLPTTPAVSNTYWQILAAASGAGTSGNSSFTATIYKVAASDPGSPTDLLTTYNFSTGVLTLNSALTSAGWTALQPNTTTTPTWACEYSFSGIPGTTVTKSGVWGATRIDAVAGANGSPGTNGTRTAVLDLYQWKSSAPLTYPVGSSTYTWSNAQFTNPATLNNWTATPGVGVAGQTLYKINQVFADSGTSLTSLITWSANSSKVIGVFGSAGTDGSNGSRTAILELYKWSATTPVTFPTGIASTYTWATGAFTLPGTPNNWSLLPDAAVAGQTLYACSVVFNDSLTTPTSSVSWSAVSTAYAIGAAGTNGSSGSNGDSVDIVFVRSATQPAIPTASVGIPNAPIQWYTNVTAANTAGGVVLPLWSSTGFKTGGVGNYTWDTTSQITGANVAEISVYARVVAGTTPGALSGGTYTFSVPPSLSAVPTGTSATWTAAVPAGSNPLWVSRAIVSTAAGNTAAVAITGWTSPVISTLNGKTYSLDVTGGIRNVTFNDLGSSPTPAQTAFTVVLYEDGAIVTPTSFTWSSSGHLSGVNSGTASYTPTCAGTFVASNNDWVKISVVYAGQTVAVTIPIAVTKIGTGGSPGAGGDSVDVVFVRSAAQPATPTASAGVPSAPIQWYTDVTAANTAGGTAVLLWSSVGLKTAGVGNYVWDTPVQVSGSSATEVTCYVRSATAPATPTTGGTFNFSTSAYVAPTAPITWSTSIPAGTNPLYTSRAVVSTAAGNTAAVAITGWTAPVLSMQDGTNGTSGTSVAVVEMYKQATSAGSLPTGTTYTFSTGVVSGTLNGWLQTMPASSTTQTYMTSCRFTAVAPTDTNINSSWTAATIVAQNGITSVVGMLSNEEHSIPTAFDGTAGDYTGCTTTMAIFEGLTDVSNSWTYAVIKTAGITCTEATSSKTQTVTAMTVDTGTVTFVASKAGYPSITNVFTVTKSKAGLTGAQGATGATGIAGTPGIDGVTLYTWIAYATNVTGTTGFTTGAWTNQSYIGIANNKTSATESTNPADYTWSLIKGTDGVAGTPGINGVTTYTWFAYATNATGTTGFTTGAWTNQSYLGIATNKITATESTNPVDYTWSKIEGALGPTVVITPDRGASFSYTDNIINGSGNADLTLTATANNITSPTYAWVFTGFATAPTPSTSATAVITAANLGVNKSAIATCTVSGLYSDKITIVRLDSSTAAAGATVGATWGVNVGGKPNSLADLDAAAATQLDKKSVVWYQSVAPTGLTAADTGDTWFDNDDNYKMYSWTGSNWQLVQNSADASTAAATAQNAAVAAQGTANSRVTTFYGTSTPTANATGDLWYNDTTKLMKRWSSAAWVDTATSGAPAGTYVGTALAQTLVADAATALANATSAQTAATTASTNATTALNKLIDIASDALLTVDEKPSIIAQRDVITTEQTGIEAQATTYAITTEKTAYTAAITALTTHLATLTSPVLWSVLTGNTTIVGATFRTKFNDVYTARQALLNAISVKAKTLADAAQVQANTATTNAATAQTTANTAITNAANADAKAVTANNALGVIADDLLLSKYEKADVLQEWNTLLAEKAAINTQATSANFALATENTTYNTAFVALGTYLNGGTPVWASGTPTWLSSLTTDQALGINGGINFRAAFSTYYTARQVILNAIATKASTIANYDSIYGTKPPADANNTTTAIQNVTTISSGGITFSGGGAIKGGQTNYNTGTGFFLGYSSGYKFSIGNPSGNYLTWDGSALTISGTLSAATGTFSGTLTAAAIDAVNTINIAGNAVTIPVSAFTSSSIALTSTYSEIQSLTINSNGGPILIIGSAKTDNMYVMYKLTVDGVTIVTDQWLIPTIMSNTPGSGNKTYKLWAREYVGGLAGDVIVSNRQLFALETKR